MTITGKITQILDGESGTSANGSTWTKREFLMSTNENGYPGEAGFVMLNDKYDSLEQRKIGDEIEVSFNISSRKFNDKVYTNLACWKIKSIKNAAADEPKAEALEQVPAGENEDDLPF